MNQQQIDSLLLALGKIAEGLSTRHEYTITGAADWDMLVILFGFFGAIIMGAGSLAWFDIRSKIESAFETSATTAENSKTDLKEYKSHVEKEFDRVWENFEKCQSECCPPRTSKQ